MTPEIFIHFLDGFLLGKDRDLTPEETQIIKDKLNSCFNKITPTLITTSDLAGKIKVVQNESVAIC